MTGRAGQTMQGVICLLAGLLIFSVQDLTLKLLSDRYPLHQAMLIRSLTAIPCFLFILRWDGGLATLASPGWRNMSLRGILNFCAYTLFYLALAALPLATTVSLYFTAPLFITLLSILFLGERVTPLRWLALLGGFAGVLVMIRPGSAIFDWAALLAVGSGLFYGASMVMARHLGAKDTAAAMSFYSNLAFLGGAAILSALFGTGTFADEGHRSLAFLLRGWAMPSATDLGLMMLCGLIAAVGLTLLTQAYRIAEANVIAPFEFSAMLWGVIWGWVFWRDWPDAIGWLGILMIIGAGLLVVYADRRPTRKESPA